MADKLQPPRTGEYDCVVRWLDRGDGTFAPVWVCHNYVWDASLGQWVKMTQPTGGGGGGVDPVGLKNASGTTINPATEETLAARLSESTFSERLGEVQASPTQYTVLDRLKTLATLLSGGLPAALTASGNLKTAVVEGLPAGSNNIGDVDVLSGPTGSSALQQQGNVAHDAVDSGNPLKIGGKAATTRPTAVAAADRVDAWFDALGRLIVQPGSGEFNDYAGEFTSNQTLTQLIAAPSGSLCIVVYDIVVATDTEGKVALLDDTTAKIVVHLAANGGFVFNSAKGWKLTSNKPLRLTSTTGGGPLNIFINYAVAP